MRFVKELRYYMDCELKMITASEAEHYEALKKAKHLNVPIGKLDDVEIVFLHYKDPETAKKKWMTRVERINWENLIIKFSYMSNCTDDLIAEFQRIHGIKKFCFVPKKFEDMEDLIIIPSRINSINDLGDDVFDWNKYLNVVDLINAPVTGIENLFIE